MSAQSTIYVIAGGPSLRNFSTQPLLGKRIIAVNNAYAIAPFAEVLFFGDHNWGKWYLRDVRKMFNGQIATCAKMFAPHGNGLYRSSLDVCDIGREGYVFGRDSGTKAISLAYLMGASRIRVGGIDLCKGPGGRTHFHPGHPRPPNEADWEKFGGSLRVLVDELKRRDVAVTRFTPEGNAPIDYEPFTIENG